MRPAIALAAVVASLAVSGCASNADDGELTVFAASSLAAVFAELGDAFEASPGGAPVRFNVAASSELVAQVAEGAPADVIALADRPTMAQLTDAGSVATPTEFASNELQIAVAPGNPLAIGGVADLADPELVVVVCAPEVPCGRYTNELVAAAGVAITPRSLEENVNAVLARVTAGEADAGVVYRTDVLGAGDDVTGVAIPSEIDVVAHYPIAVATTTDDPSSAAAFVAFVQSDTGQAILAAYGFGPP
jgi:molybdate transport system substrate-binding protein